MLTGSKEKKKRKKSWKKVIYFKAHPDEMPEETLTEQDSVEFFLEKTKKAETVANINIYRTQLQRINDLIKNKFTQQNFLGTDEIEHDCTDKKDCVKCELTNHRKLNKFLYSYLRKMSLGQRVDDPNIPSNALE